MIITISLGRAFSACEYLVSDIMGSGSSKKPDEFDAGNPAKRNEAATLRERNDQLLHQNQQLEQRITQLGQQTAKYMHTIKLVRYCRELERILKERFGGDSRASLRKLKDLTSKCWMNPES